MPSFSHKKIIETILNVDTLPSDPGQFTHWVEASKHIEFLRRNAFADEVVIYGSVPYSFIYSIIVPDDVLRDASHDDLVHWSCNPYRSIANFVSGGGREDMWIERGGSGRGSKALDEGTDLIFARTFEGWSGTGNLYFEVNQEYSHLTGIHWRPEASSYCRFDNNGDLRHVVSVTMSDGVNNISRQFYMG